MIPALRLKEHEGEYVCYAENVAGKKSVAFNVAVWQTPDFTEAEQVANQTVGERIELFCDVDGHPPPVISWVKNGHPIGFHSGLELTENNKRLRINTATLNDIGLYQCVAQNQAGESRKSFQVIFMFLQLKYPKGEKMGTKGTNRWC